MSQTNRQALYDHLHALEDELKALGWWSRIPPDQEAMNSRMPFCHDRMPLQQWLQWVFIPRIRQLLENDLPLPPSCGIAPLAALIWQERTDTQKIEAILRQIDQCFTS